MKSKKEELASQLTDANRLIVEEVDRTDADSMKRKMRLYLRSKEDTRRIAGVILLHKLTLHRPYGTMNLDMFKRFIDEFASGEQKGDVEFHLFVAFARSVRELVKDGFLDSNERRRKVKPIIERNMFNIMKRPSKNHLLRRCAAVKALGILETNLHYPAVRELMYSDPYEKGDNAPNIALVDAAASAICEIRHSEAFEELKAAYGYAARKAADDGPLYSDVVVVLLDSMHGLARRTDLEPGLNSRIFDFLLDNGYFKSDAPFM